MQHFSGSIIRGVMGQIVLWALAILVAGAVFGALVSVILYSLIN